MDPTQASQGDFSTLRGAYSAMMALQARHPIDLLLDTAGVCEGGRVLDLGTERGCVAARAAERKAFPIGLAHTASRLEVARRRYPDVDYAPGDAEDLPYPAHVFDAAVSYMRLPHYADPDVVMREALRVLTEGGVFAFACWASRDEAPMLDIAREVFAANGSVPPDTAWERGLPAFGDRRYCARQMSAAGFIDVRARKVPVLWSVPANESVGEAFAAVLCRSDDLIAHRSPGAVAAIDAGLRAACAAYGTDDGGVALPGWAVIASGRKP